MIKELKHIEKTQILDLLKDRNGWNSYFLNYHEPFEERVWKQVGQYRLHLQVFYHCIHEKSLYHPHPWPKAMHIIAGELETGISYSFNEEDYKDTESGNLTKKITQDQLIKFELKGESYFEIVNPKCWHYLNPINTNCHAVMLTDTPWFKGPKAHKPLMPLDEERIQFILNYFIHYYETIR